MVDRLRTGSIQASLLQGKRQNEMVDVLFLRILRDYAPSIPGFNSIDDAWTLGRGDGLQPAVKDGECLSDGAEVIYATLRAFNDGVRIQNEVTGSNEWIAGFRECGDKRVKYSRTTESQPEWWDDPNRITGEFHHSMSVFWSCCPTPVLQKTFYCGGGDCRVISNANAPKNNN